MNYIMYFVTAVLLTASYMKDKKQTLMALRKALKSFENILPQFIGIILFVGMLLSIFDQEFISNLIGGSSGWISVVLSSSVGAITLIPGFVAFPIAAVLLDNGAGYMQIGAFVSSLMMVGVMTAPMEIKYFGKRLTVLRNVFAFLFSFIVAYIIGKVV